MKLDPGTHITCEGGHHIATVRYGLDEHAAANANDFEWHITPAPQNGDVTSPCSYCGAGYVRFLVGSVWQIYTPAGWWPE